MGSRFIEEFEVEQIETSTIYLIGSVTTRSGKKQEDSKLSVERAELRKLKLNVTPVGGDRLSRPIEVIPTPKSNWYSLSITKDELIELQKEDLSLKTCFVQVGCQKKIHKVKFFLKEGILCRQNKDDEEENKGIAPEIQMVVPKSLRKEILVMSHDIPISGHQGMDRTLSRITAHFFWARHSCRYPKLRKFMFCLSEGCRPHIFETCSFDTYTSRGNAIAEMGDGHHWSIDNIG